MALLLLFLTIIFHALRSPRYTGYQYDIACDNANDRVFVTNYDDAIAVINVSDSSSPVRIGKLQDETNLADAYGIDYDPINELLFVTCFSGNRLTVLSVAAPAS